MKKILNEKNIILTIIIVLAILSRLIEHPMNFTPVFALALFSAVYFSNRMASLLIPFGVMFISDIFIGISTLNIAVYFTFGLSYLIGTLYLRNKISIGRLAISSLSISVLFFVISNFYVWAIDPFSMYPKTLDGFIMCYQMALPFFRNSVLGDMFYSGLLFGSFSLAEKYYLSRANTKQMV